MAFGDRVSAVRPMSPHQLLIPLCRRSKMVMKNYTRTLVGVRFKQAIEISNMKAELNAATLESKL